MFEKPKVYEIVLGGILVCVMPMVAMGVGMIPGLLLGSEGLAGFGGFITLCLFFVWISDSGGGWGGPGRDPGE